MPLKAGVRLDQDDDSGLLLVPWTVSVVLSLVYEELVDDALQDIRWDAFCDPVFDDVHHVSDGFHARMASKHKGVVVAAAQVSGR